MGAPASSPPPPEPGTEERLKDLEARLKRLEKKPKDLWDKFQSISGVVSGLLVAVVGYFLTSSINKTLQERQFQVSSAKDMQELLMRISNPKTELADKESAALVLANFGRYAVQPLVNQLQTGEANRSIAAEQGLRVIGQADPEYMCREMTRILENRTRIFTWYTHRSVIRLLRDTECRAAVPALRAYRESLGDSERYQLRVSQDPAPTPESLDLLRAEADSALKILRP
jgi:hypothetical protein